MSLVRRIQELCGSENTTLIGLERETGLGRGTIRNWDRNSPSIDKVQRVAEYFGVSADYLLYGFNKDEFTSLINFVRFRRSIKEFSLDTGIDEYYLNRLCSGVEYEQPSIGTVLKIAIHNDDNDWLVDANSLFKAAGYDLEEISGDLLKDIPLELLHHYQEQGMSETEMVIDYAKFREAEFKDAMAEPSHEDGINTDIETIISHRDEGYNLSENEILTLAAHQVGHEGALTEEQLAQIKLALKIALAKNDK
ncbi:helix-turn-helix transcriptional regulator [Paenibacillus larvae]